MKSQWDSIYSPLDEADILHDPFCALTLPSLGKFKQFTKKSNVICNYSDSVKRDFLRALAVEIFAHPCDIYTLNKYEDNVRHGEQLSTKEINANMSHKDFLCSLRHKK